MENNSFHKILFNFVKKASEFEKDDLSSSRLNTVLKLVLENDKNEDKDDNNKNDDKSDKDDDDDISDSFFKLFINEKYQISDKEKSLNILEFIQMQFSDSKL